jgi:hypothetical protein
MVETTGPVVEAVVNGGRTGVLVVDTVGPVVETVGPLVDAVEPIVEVVVTGGGTDVVETTGPVV